CRGQRLPAFRRYGRGERDAKAAARGFRGARRRWLRRACADRARPWDPEKRMTCAFRRRLQIVVQDPLASPDPRMRVEAIVGEPLEIHEPQLSRPARRARIAETLEAV